MEIKIKESQDQRDPKAYLQIKRRVGSAIGFHSLWFVKTGYCCLSQDKSVLSVSKNVSFSPETHPSYFQPLYEGDKIEITL